MSRTVLTPMTDIDWAGAKEAAQRIIKRCDDAPFTAPEATAIIQRNIQAVCIELDIIVRALKITPPGGK
jgi:hypothetical protein